MDKIRSLWNNYINDLDAMIYFIDVNDSKRFQESKHELENLLKNREIVNVPLLLFGNKIDLPEAKSFNEISDVMDFKTLLKDRKWKYQETCATSGEGIFEGLNWIIEQLNN